MNKLILLILLIKSTMLLGDEKNTPINNQIKVYVMGRVKTQKWYEVSKNITYKCLIKKAGGYLEKDVLYVSITVYTSDNRQYHIKSKHFKKKIMHNSKIIAVKTITKDRF